MRLSEWRENAPLAEAASDAVMAVVEPLLVDLGASADPESWVVWGEDPGMKYSILAPALGGLITVAVRPLGSQDGPRAGAKLIRWSKLAVSELNIDSTGGHRIVAVQVESYVLKGVDEEADHICEFVRNLIAGIENRVPQIQQLVPGYAPVMAAGPAAGVASTAPASSASRTRRGAAGQSKPAASARKREPASHGLRPLVAAPVPKATPPAAAPAQPAAAPAQPAAAPAQPAAAMPDADAAVPAAAAAPPPAEGTPAAPATLPALGPVIPVPMHRVPHTGQPATSSAPAMPVAPDRAQPPREGWGERRPIPEQPPAHKKQKRWMP
jgi:hypothetical protein